MLLVAVCDDDKKDLEEITAYLRRYDVGGILQIMQFRSAAELLRAAQKQSFDLAVLDIEMDAPNGFEAAQQLLQQKDRPLILFVTNSMAYTLRGYGVAFRYLVKPLGFLQLSEVMDAAVRELRANRFVFSVDGSNHVVKMQGIYYFEVFQHYTTLHLMDEQFLIRSTLKDVLAQLPSGYFAVPHQSYIVNFAHVKTASATELRLTNGARIPISRRRQQEFERLFFSYLGR